MRVVTAEGSARGSGNRALGTHVVISSRHLPFPCPESLPGSRPPVMFPFVTVAEPRDMLYAGPGGSMRYLRWLWWCMDATIMFEFHFREFVL